MIMHIQEKEAAQWSQRFHCLRRQTVLKYYIVGLDNDVFNFIVQKIAEGNGKRVGFPPCTQKKSGMAAN